MKKLICALMALCLCIPISGYASATAQPTADPSVVEFNLPIASAQTTATSSLMRVAYLDNYLSQLALNAQSVGSGWASQADIPDLWAPVYSYLVKYDLASHADWETTAQGFVRVPAKYVKELFQNMFGHAFTELPPVSRNYSSTIVYDAQSDVYDVSGAASEGALASIASVALGDDGSATVVYKLSAQASGDNSAATSLGQVAIYLNGGADATYGFMPVKLDYAPVK